MRQCDATTLATTYSHPHRCSKVHGLRRVGGRVLCAHHRPGEPTLDEAAGRLPGPEQR